MAAEEIIEKGIVVTADNGYADIALLGGDNCGECSAKLFCKPSEGEQKILQVVDSYKTEPGDEVSISVSGSSIFKVSFFLYGLPLIIIIASVIAGVEYFKETTQPELYSFLVSICFITVYYILFLFIGKKRNNNNLMPKITSVIRHID